MPFSQRLRLPWRLVETREEERARERALGVLDSLGLDGFADRLTHRLSGGEKKLVSIASVLSMQPQALLLDEPTTFLDDESKERIIAILREQTCAQVIISHDRDFLERTASLFIRIGKRRPDAPLFSLPPPGQRDAGHGL